MSKMNKFFKKTLALTTAMTMVMTPCAVFASEVTADPDKVEAGGNAGVEYYENNIKKVTLPTATSLNSPFIIDPQGVLSITANDGTGKPVAAAVGTIVPKSLVKIKNESSFPVNITADIYVTKDLTTGEASSVSLVANDTGLATSTANELLLNVYSTGSITDTALTTLEGKTMDHTFTADAAFTTPPIVISANGKTNAMELSFLLKESTYILTKKDGVIGWVTDSAATDNYSQVAFCIGGKVAQKADWSAYGSGDGQENIAVKAVFTLEKSNATVTDKVTTTSAAAAAATFLSDSSYTEVSDDKTTATLADYTIADTENDLSIPIDFGKGGKKVTVSAVYIIQAGGTAAALVEGTDYEVTSAGITLKESSETLWCFEWPAECSVSIGCADVEGTETWLTVNFATVE